MNIVILTAVFEARHIGGTEISTYYLARELVKMGHQVHIISSGDRTLPKESVEEGFFVHRIQYPVGSSLGMLSFWFKTFLYLRKIHVDIIHSQSVQMGLPCVAANLFLKKPYVVWGQGSDIYLPWKFKKIISAMIFSRASAIVALTLHMKNSIPKKYQHNVVIIPFGIDHQAFKGLSQEFARQQLAIAPAEKIILFVGDLKTVKGVEYLIQALPIIKNTIPGVRLMLAGDGPERQALESLAKNNNVEKQAHFMGSTSHDKVIEYMAAADMLALSSLSEGLPNVLLEAMACGTPIVTTNVRGIPEIIQDGINGFLVEPKRPEQIAQQVIRLFSDNDLQKRISANNREQAKQYSWEIAADKFIELYSGIVNKK
ncbi:MAG: glycosyltransferase family 1 protein [Candidatus Staskawiczbacteria bacterium]|nr:glycosyltransferase family 1 protein [Candidatus Staskawiczbacteria bacterium]